MTSLDASRSLPALKSFALTHILYDPTSHLSIPLTLLSLSPIFLFVSYFTLIIFNRRLTVLLLAGGSVANEILSLGLKRIWKGERPFKGLGEVGDGYGMPSSHSQAAAFLAAWGLGYTLMHRDRFWPSINTRLGIIKKIRTGVYVFGLGTWSLSVAYSRWHLLYHSIPQVAAGYIIGLLAGAAWLIMTEYIPARYPSEVCGSLRALIESLWVGIGGVGGSDLGSSVGGWGEGWLFGVQVHQQQSPGALGQTNHTQAQNRSTRGSPSDVFENASEAVQVLTRIGDKKKHR